MKTHYKFILILLSVLCSTQVFAQKNNGYQIKVHLTQPVRGNYMYLAHYYAKGFPTIYKVDSAKVDNEKQEVIFQSKDSILGGVYLILINENSQYFEFLLDNGDHFEVFADSTKLPLGVTFKNSIANEKYMQMNENFIAAGTKVKELKTQGKEAATGIKVKEIYKEAYQKNLNLAQELGKSTLFSKIIYAFTPPNDPPATSYTKNGEIDSTEYAYLIKEAYWNNYDLSDDRLIHTPFYDNKLKVYFDNYVYNFIPDSVIYESEKMLYHTSQTTENFKYTLQWLLQYTYANKAMGMDKAFIHLVENYYMKGKAYWLDSVQLKKITDRAMALAPNVIGKKGADIRLYDLYSLKQKSLYNFEAPYTLLVFWSIDCGFCLEEVPLLKASYDSTLKAQGVRVFSVPVGEEQAKIQDKIKELGLEDWEHVIDIGQEDSDYKDNYDAYSKPKIYLLDKDKVIKGKNLDHDNVIKLMEILERKEESKSN